METYKKNDLINDVAEATGATKALTSDIVDAVFDAIINGVISNDCVSIHQFGKFEKKVAKEHTGRNPRTGEDVVVPEHNVVKFKVYKEFKEAVL